MFSIKYARELQVLLIIAIIGLIVVIIKQKSTIDDMCDDIEDLKNNYVPKSKFKDFAQNVADSVESIVDEKIEDAKEELNEAAKNNINEVVSKCMDSIDTEDQISENDVNQIVDEKITSVVTVLDQKLSERFDKLDKKIKKVKEDVSDNDGLAEYVDSQLDSFAVAMQEKVDELTDNENMIIERMNKMLDIICPDDEDEDEEDD